MWRMAGPDSRSPDVKSPDTDGGDIDRAAIDTVVLAGGRARRLGGADKPMVEIGGKPLLERVLEACAGSGRAIVVGPRRPIAREVAWVLEQPPGGGPAAAVAAALNSCSREWVGVFAADLPFLDAHTVHSLWITLRSGSADRGRDGAVTVDADGREQWLAAIYRREALVAAVARVGPDGLAGLPLRRLVADLDLVRAPAPQRALMDCDTWDDVDSARRIAGDGPRKD